MKLAIFALTGFALITASSVAAQTGQSHTGNPNSYSPPAYVGVYEINPGPARAISRAIDAINKKDYGAAKMILAGIRDSEFGDLQSLARFKFLAGLARAGTNDLTAARAYFSEAQATDRNFLDANVALAMISLKLDDRPAADALLNSLVARQQSCRSRCAQSAEFDRVVPIVQTVIARQWTPI